MSNNYLGNEGARELTEENASRELVPYLKDNQEFVHDDDSMFYIETKNMFRPIPFNRDVIEKRFLKVDPTEKSDSEIFTFENGESGGGVIKLDESTMSCTLSVKYNLGPLEDETWCDIMPRPLHTMWKSVDLTANGVTITNSNTENMFVSDILNRLYEHSEKSTDLAGCCLGYRNKPGQHGYLSKMISSAISTSAKTDNPGANERVKALREDRYIIDLQFAFFGMGPQFLPVNNRLNLKFTKDTNRRLFTGSEMEYAGAQTGNDSDFHIANAHTGGNAAYIAHVTNGGQSATNLGHLDNLKTTLKHFEIHYKILTPDAQIQEDK